MMQVVMIFLVTLQLEEYLSDMSKKNIFTQLTAIYYKYLLYDHLYSKNLLQVTGTSLVLVGIISAMITIPTCRSGSKVLPKITACIFLQA